MKPRSFVILVGLILTIGGLVLGFFGTSVTVRTENPFDPGMTDAAPVACGSAFSANNPLTVPFGGKMSDAVPLCDEALDSRVPWVWILMGAGLLAVLGGAVVKTGQPAPAA